MTSKNHKINIKWQAGGLEKKSILYALLLNMHSPHTPAQIYTKKNYSVVFSVFKNIAIGIFKLSSLYSGKKLNKKVMLDIKILSVRKKQNYKIKLSNNYSYFLRRIIVSNHDFQNTYTMYFNISSHALPPITMNTYGARPWSPISLSIKSYQVWRNEQRAPAVPCSARKQGHFRKSCQNTQELHWEGQVE